MTRLGIAGLATHVFFELGAGVGMPLASFAGPVRAAVLWAATAGSAWQRAGRSPRDRPFALINGFGIAAVTAHLVGWPSRRTRIGLPWLRDCEGLGPRLMRYYNPILYLSLVACGAAVVRENRDAPRALALVPLGSVPLLIAAQHAEHKRLKHIAAHAPAWWNRRLAVADQQAQDTSAMEVMP
jgi:hypothetical protein